MLGKLKASGANSILLSLFLFCLGEVLHPIPLSIDSVISPTEILGTFFLFLFWVHALYSWGKLLCFFVGLDSSSDRIAFRLSLGTLFAALSIVILGHLHLIGYETSIIPIGVLFLGPLISGFGVPSSKLPRLRLRRTLVEWISIAPLFLIGVWAFALVLKASVPHFTSDPLMYHLVGARFWFQQGGFTVPTLSPVYELCSYWEYHYIWANILVGGAGSGGLIEAQVFSQWIHVILGWLGTVLILNSLLKSLRVDSKWIPACLLLACNCDYLVWTSCLAQNDWGVAFWTLCGAAFLFSEEIEEKKGLALAGLFWGLAFEAKYSSVFGILAFFSSWVVWKGSLSFFKTVRIALFGLITLTPILLRNLYLAHNPLFPAPMPWITQFFSSHLSTPEFETNVAKLSPTFSIAAHNAYLRLQMTWTRQPLLLAAFLVPLLLLGLWRSRKAIPSRLILLSIIALSVGVFSFVIQPLSSFDDGTLFLRWLGSGLIVSSIALPLLCGEVVVSRFRRFQDPFTCIIILAILLFSMSTTRIPKIRPLVTLNDMQTTTEAARKYAMGGDSKAWLRLNTTASDFIVTTGDNQFYYLADLQVASVPDQPFFRELLSKSDELTPFLKRLAELNIFYLLDTQHFETRYWSPLAARIDAVLQSHPSAILFEGHDSYVVSIQVLLNEIDPTCSLPQSLL